MSLEDFFDRQVRDVLFDLESRHIQYKMEAKLLLNTMTSKHESGGCCCFVPRFVPLTHTKEGIVEGGLSAKP